MHIYKQLWQFWGIAVQHQVSCLVRLCIGLGTQCHEMHAHQLLSCVYGGLLQCVASHFGCPCLCIPFLIVHCSFCSEAVAAILHACYAATLIAIKPSMQFEAGIHTPVVGGAILIFHVGGLLVWCGA